MSIDERPACTHRFAGVIVRFDTAIAHQLLARLFCAGPSSACPLCCSALHSLLRSQSVSKMTFSTFLQEGPIATSLVTSARAAWRLFTPPRAAWRLFTSTRAAWRLFTPPRAVACESERLNLAASRDRVLYCGTYTRTYVEAHACSVSLSAVSARVRMSSKLRLSSLPFRAPGVCFRDGLYI